MQPIIGARDAMIGSDTVQSGLLCPAIVIEWETALAAGSQRAAACLDALCRQLRAMEGRLKGIPEIVITYSPTRNCGAAIRSAMERAAGADGWRAHISVVPAPHGTDYYGQKNFGFSLTHNEAVVFLDSDLIPEAGWLEEILAPLNDYRVSVVVGNTYMDTSSRYAKCVALFWIFDTRAHSPALVKTSRLVSNSIAFRSAVFRRFPFPRRPTFRGQCSELAAILKSQGICLYLNSAAQSAHPPPRGFAQFIERAMFAGHDECSYRKFSGSTHPGHAMVRFWIDLREVRRRVAQRRGDIGASAGIAIAGTCLGFAYYSFKLIGYLITLASPAALRRWFAA